MIQVKVNNSHLWAPVVSGIHKLGFDVAFSLSHRTVDKFSTAIHSKSFTMSPISRELDSQLAHVLTNTSFIGLCRMVFVQDIAPFYGVI
jgi:hypothetical protein